VDVLDFDLRGNGGGDECYDACIFIDYFWLRYLVWMFRIITKRREVGLVIH